MNWFLFENSNNIINLGFLIFVYHSNLIILLSLVLLIAMIGSIVLLVNWKNVSIKNDIYLDLYFFNYKSIKFIN